MPITDNFNRASLGASWEAVLGPAWSLYNDTVIHVAEVARQDSVDYQFTAMRRTESFSGDHYAQADCEFTDDTFATNGRDGGFASPAVRVQSNGDCYYAEMRNGYIDVNVRSGGVSTYIGDSGLLSPILSYNTLYTLKLVATGSSIQLYLNGVLKATITNSTLTGGKPGLFGYAGEATQDVALPADTDNFECTDALASETFPAGHVHSRVNTLVRM